MLQVQSCYKVCYTLNMNTKKTWFIGMIIILVIIAIMFLREKSTYDLASTEKQPDATIKMEKMPYITQEPTPGKYQFIRDYVVSSCIETIWGDFPSCKDDKYHDVTLFQAGDVVLSQRAFFDDQGTGWGIGLDGATYGGSNMRIDMGYVKKVPDSTPEKYKSFN